MEIKHLNMSLFEAPKGSLIVHACNGVGVWGRGIARAFKDKFPQAFERYSAACKGQDLLGKALVIEDSGYFIGCLITSRGYGDTVDPPEQILAATETALEDLCGKLPAGASVYSNKFNSGLFFTPWDKTEALLLRRSENFVWHVCTPQE